MNWIEENTVKAVIPNKGGLQQMILTSVVRENIPDKLFWERLEAFVKEVEVSDPMSYEEREMILNTCKKYL